MVDFLCEKFKDHETPKYLVCEVDRKQLYMARDSFKHQEFAATDV